VKAMPAYLEGRSKATWQREFKLPLREAGPPNHHDDKVDSDQQVSGDAGGAREGDARQPRQVDAGGPYQNPVLPESENLALTFLSVPHSLDIGALNPVKAILASPAKSMQEVSRHLVFKAHRL